MNNSQRTSNLNAGILIMILATIIIMIWLGIAKFFDFEAKAIQGLVENHPLMSWMYNVFNYRTVSNIIGVSEIATGILLVIGLFKKVVLKWAGALMILTFITTTSFLFTTPGISTFKEGFPVTDFFILKDLVFLGLGIALWCGVDSKKLY